MRLNLYWRGVDLIDVEIHACRPRPPDPPAADQLERPITARGDLAAADLADDHAEPATRVAFGFGRHDPKGTPR